MQTNLSNLFFQNLYENCEGLIEIRPLPGERAFFKTDDFSGIALYCKRYSTSNLYFGVATRNGRAGKKENIIHIPAVWSDVDFKMVDKRAFAEDLKKFPFSPSLIVLSGGGVHLYWILKEPAEKSESGLVEDVNRRIARNLNGDTNATDAARILRIPGTINHKYPKPVTLHRVNPFRYNLEDFIEVLPETEDIANPCCSKSEISESILKCGFLQWCREHPAEVSEPLWYAAISNIVSIRPGGYSLCHEISKGHPEYKPSETDRKIHQALDASAPHSCTYIKKNGYKCPTDCGVKSPVGMLYRKSTESHNAKERASVSFG